MVRPFACCPFLRESALLSAGLLMGMWLPAWLPKEIAAQEKEAASAEEQVRKLNLTLPAVAKPTNTLVNALRVGDLLYISGTGPGKAGGKALVGRLGDSFDVAQGKAAARQVGLQVLSVVKTEVGSLDKVQRLV